MPFKYDDIQYICKGGYIVTLNSKKGLFWTDLKQKEFLIPVEYDDIVEFRSRYNRCYQVRKNGKYGIFDVLRNYVTPIEYEKIEQDGY